MTVDALGMDERERRAAARAARAAGTSAPVTTPTAAQFRVAEEATMAEPAVAAAAAGSAVPDTTGTTGVTGMSPEQVQKMITDAVTANDKKWEARLQGLATEQRQMQEQQTATLRRSAYEVMRERFTSYGLTGLADELTSILKGEGVTRGGQKITDIPTTSQGFYLALTETKAYYDRFGAVNEQRIKEGFTALDEKTILGLEDQYQTVMKAYNAPAGFYDKPEDFRMFLRYNKSKAEVADTMQAFSDFVQSTDTTARQQLKDFYGIDDAALTAYFADPEKGQPLLEAIAARNLNTAAALAGGLNARIANLAAGLGAAELTYAQQKQKYGAVARDIEFAQKAADIYGIDYTPEMAVAAEFGADQAALASQRRARRREAAEFQGQAGVGATTLGTRTAGLI